MPLSVINSSSRIGEGVIVNTNSCIEHDNYLMDYSSVGPSVTTGGNVNLGKRSAICIGSVINNNILIGSDTIIGAKSLVNKNLTDKSIFYGVPAKFVRERLPNEPYLKKVRKIS